jgi:hypothetical protein
MEQLSTAQPCYICQDICNCHFWESDKMLSQDFAIYLSKRLAISAKELWLHISAIRTRTEGGNVSTIFLDLTFVSRKTGKKQGVAFSLASALSGHARHSAFVKLYSTTIAPVAQMLKDVFLADRIHNFSVKLNPAGEVTEALFWLHTNKKDGAHVLINLAQSEHFDETGTLKQGALVLAFYKGLQELGGTDFVDGVTYETLEPESKGYYLKSDLPANKKPTTFYSADTIKKLEGVSPYTRKRFTDADIIEIVVPTRKECMELPSVANCLPPLTSARTESDTAGCRNLTQISMSIQRTLSAPGPSHSDAQSAPPRFRPFSEECARV